MRANRADASAQFKALTNHVRELVENLGQVTARALLQQHGGNEEMYVERRHPFRELQEGYIQRQPKIVFFKSTAEFARERLLKFAMNHFERYGKCMPGAQDRKSTRLN